MRRRAFWITTKEEDINIVIGRISAFIVEAERKNMKVTITASSDPREES